MRRISIYELQEELGSTVGEEEAKNTQQCIRARYDSGVKNRRADATPTEPEDVLLRRQITTN